MALPGRPTGRVQQAWSWVPLALARLPYLLWGRLGLALACP